MKKSVIIFFFILLQISLFSFICSSKEPVLKAGISKVDITPSENLYMGGYEETCRMDKSDGSAGKIFIRALVFDDSFRKVAFVEADIVSLPNENYMPIRKMIEAETGIPAANIILGCVHNHAAPSYSDENNNSAWYKQFNSNMIKAVKQAVADLEPVKIGGGLGRSDIAMNRRRRMEDSVSELTFDENNSSQSYGKFKTDNPVQIREMEGVVRLGANPDGPIDNVVGIMRIDKLSGQPKAVMVNYACHGTSLGARNNKIDPEWNGHMLEYIEKTIPGVQGIFCQGASGDINPKVVGGLGGYKDSPENTARIGSEIGREVVRVFDGIKTENPIDPQIKIVSEDIVCPLKYGEVVKDFRKTTIGVPSTAVRIDQFTWVTFPGELFHEIGQAIKASTHSGYPFLVGYSNGSLGYLPTQQSHSEGGYEPWSTRFDPVTEKIFRKGVEKMLTGLQ